MSSFDGPRGLTFNRGMIADAEAFAREAGAASWLFLCGEEFAGMEGGLSYMNVQAAVPESENIVSDPPRVLDMNAGARADRRPRPPAAPDARHLPYRPARLRADLPLCRAQSRRDRR